MKVFLSALLLPGLVGATILPDTIGAFHRCATSPATITDRAVWDEYGLKDSEAATYQSDSAKFTATAYQLGDTTGALAAFDWQRPAGAKASGVARLAAETPGVLLLVHGNYLLVFSGY